MRRRPVVAIGLDSAEPKVVETWMKQGHLPTLSTLRERGVYGRLQNFEAFSAETPWTVFATGCSPQTTGYWSPLRFVEGTYDMVSQKAYDYEEFPPFYADPSLRCAIFDVPQVRIDPRVNGIQVSAWGAHSPQVDQGSMPAGLLEDITETYGPHPALNADYAVCVDGKTTMRVVDRLLTGIERRGRICHDLLKQEPWDLFVTVFGEAHSAGHNFWQLSQPEHPLYDEMRSRLGLDHDPMLQTFQAMDKAIGQVLEAAPEDAAIVIFSAHGMGANTMDLPSATFLPEALYRYSFPGETALAAGELGAPVPPPVVDMDWKYWERHVWNTKSNSTLFQKLMRRMVPNQLIRQLEPYFEDVSGTTDLIPPVTLASRSTTVPFEPASWYTPLWPKMKAFALPTFSEGYVRINLQGREPEGIVAPEDYVTVREDIIANLMTLRCARTGKQMVRDVIRTRTSGLDSHDPKRPDADVVLLWQEDYASDVVECEAFGRIGPVPHYRAGSHRAKGFMIAGGQGIPAQAHTFHGHGMDIPATLLALAGAEIPSRIEGRPLAFTRDRASAA